MNNFGDSVVDTNEVFEIESSKVVTSEKKNIIIKCGEVQLIKNDWNLQLVCEQCGKEMVEIQEFLFHSLQHHFDVTENEINLLISKVSGQKTVEKIEVDDQIEVVIKEETNIEEQELSAENNEINFSSEPTVTDETYPLPKDNLPILQPEKLTSSITDKDNNKNFEFLDTAENIIENKGEADESDSTSKNQPQSHSTSSSNVQTFENFFNNFVCKHCEEAFENITNYAKHIEQHAGFNLYDCPKCDKGYVLIAQLKRHVRTHIKNQNAKLKRNQNNENAIENYDQLIDPSEICSTILTEPTAEQKFEFQEVHLPKKKRVARVSAKTENTEDQQVETKQQNKAEESPKVPKKKRLRAKPNENGEYKCTECEKVFDKRFSLTVHYRTHTKKPFVTCEICGANFADSTNLYTHRKRHMGIKKHKCTMCDKSFVASNELTIHMRTHTGERPYTCEECGRSFITSSSYCDHRRRHTNDRPYVCETCGKRFYDKKTLRKHQRSHTGETPYPCTECSMSFGQPNSLKEHLKLHSGIKGHICKICGQAFIQNAGLYSHMKRHKKEAALEALKTDTFAG